MTRRHHTDNDCQHITAAGRRCRMLRARNHDLLCAYHVRLKRQEAEQAEALTDDILGPVEDFKSAVAVNHALGNLFVLTARNRIPVRRAAILAYIAQLILNSLPALRREAAGLLAEPVLQQALARILNCPSRAAARAEFTESFPDHEAAPEGSGP